MANPLADLRALVSGPGEARRRGTVVRALGGGAVLVRLTSGVETRAYGAAAIGQAVVLSGDKILGRAAAPAEKTYRIK